MVLLSSGQVKGGAVGVGAAVGEESIIGLPVVELRLLDVDDAVVVLVAVVLTVMLTMAVLVIGTAVRVLVTVVVVTVNSDSVVTVAWSVYVSVTVKPPYVWHEQALENAVDIELLMALLLAPVVLVPSAAWRLRNMAKTAAT